MKSRLLPAFYTRTGSAQAGFAQKDFGVTDGQEEQKMAT
jgi:hypothetical protein